MALTINKNGLTITEQDNIDILATAIFATAITGGTISEYVNIESGVLNGDKVPLIGLLSDVGKAAVGCADTAGTQAFSLSNKTWETAVIGDRVQFCITQWGNVQKQLQRSITDNPAKYDITEGNNAESEQVVLMLVTQAIEQAINRLVWFGSTTLVANNLTNAGQLPFMNVIDGLWHRIETEVPAANKINILKNEETTEAAQLNLGASDAYDIFEKMYDAITPQMRITEQSGEELVIYTTRSLYSNYKKYLRDASRANTNIEVRNGAGEESFEGIRIIPIDFWDVSIKTYFDSGTALTNPHRAILTFKSGLVVGTTNENDLNELDVFYDKNSKMNKMDFEFGLGTILPEEGKVIYAI